MVRSSLFIVLAMLFVSPSRAQVVRWQEDTLTLRQTGCSYSLDSVTGHILNTGTSAVVLDTVEGPTKSWQIADPLSHSHVLLPPGAIHPVQLYLVTPDRFRNEVLVFHLDGGAKDTVQLREDVQTSRLYSSFGDTVSYSQHRALDSAPLEYFFPFIASGTQPFLVRSFGVIGDTTFSVMRSSDTVRTGSSGPMWGLKVTHQPTTFGTDTLIVSIGGSPCDSLFTFVLFVTTLEPAPDLRSVVWDHQYPLGLSSPCGKFVTTSNLLVNHSDQTLLVDSVRILGDTLFSLESSPPNRHTGFTMLPNDTTRYQIRFGGTQTDIERHEAKLVVFVGDGTRDTVDVTGIFASARLTASDTLFEFGLRDITEGWQRYTTVDRSGQGSFIVSDIRSEGPMEFTLTNLEIGTVVTSQRYIGIFARSNVTGYQEGKLIIVGSVCDTALTLTVRGTFDSVLKVDLSEEAPHGLQLNGSQLINLTGKGGIRIYDIGGRLIILSPRRELDLSTLPAGTYFAVSASGASIKFVR